MKRSLTPEKMKSIIEELSAANARFEKVYPGESTGRQAVHTVYGGAHLFSAGLAKKLGQSALKALEENAPDGKALAKALGEAGADENLWRVVHERVVGKLKREPVEDFRIDFEDGYGNRSDEEEDGHAASVAKVVAEEWKAKALPAFSGIRIKPFSRPCFARSHRTLDIFLNSLLEGTGGEIPEGFVVTLPKVTRPEQTRALAESLTIIEKANGLKQGTLKFEFMVEMTQSILDENGHCPLRAYAEAGEGRCVAAHFGTYDYTAGNGITAAYQSMNHPACDFAKQMMKVALSGTGLLLSDGATNVMPVGNRDTVHRAWKLSYDHIRHSLRCGFYQGWDLHPAQLPVRYAAMYAFFLEALTPATERLSGFIDKAARATLLGDVFDDAATGQGLLNFFLRGLSWGALTEAEAKATGLTLKELHSRSFLAILDGRKGS